MHGKNEYEPEPAKVITISREKYRGETDLEYQVKSEQVGFYKYGQIVFQLLVVLLLTLLVAMFLFMLINVVIIVVGWAFIQQIIEGLQNIQVY